MKASVEAWELETMGHLSMKGVTLPLTTTLEIVVAKDGATRRGRGKGDLLVLKSSFHISRSEFGIKPGENLSKVGDKVAIDVAIVGYPKL